MRFSSSISKFVICIVAFMVTDVVADGEYREVETKLGRVRGIREVSFLRKSSFYAFKGIPYAKPPIGELRFKSPEPVEPWHSQTFDATKHPNTCLTPNFLSNFNETQSEDCLTLSIYVPSSARPDKKLAVMFWIHGGGFFEFSGSENMHGPDFLVEQNVIVVTINYRLGIFGFLSLNTPEYSGNMGLKDQQLALKWTHENIDTFFGDHRRITIFGESAGGASTHFQVLSSESRKYFHNAIALSGTAFTPWALSDEKNHIALANSIAEDLGKPTNSLDALIHFLKTTPGKTLAPSVFLTASAKTHKFKFAPVIERKDAKNPFMVAMPHEIYKTSNIDRDVIFYHTSNEMLLFVSTLSKFFNFWEPAVNITVDMPFVEFDFPPDTQEYGKLSELVRKFYLPNGLINEDSLPQYTDMMNDALFFYPTHRSIRFHRNQAKTFYIRFSVNSTLNLLKRMTNCMDKPGAVHADEICYLFRNQLCEEYYKEMFKNMENRQAEIKFRTIEYITKLFSNFAKYGEPTYKNDLIAGFHAIKGNEINYLDITNEGLKLDVNPGQKAMEFWSRLENQAQRLVEDKVQQH